MGFHTRIKTAQSIIDAKSSPCPVCVCVCVRARACVDARADVGTYMADTTVTGTGRPKSVIDWYLLGQHGPRGTSLSQLFVWISQCELGTQLTVNMRMHRECSMRIHCVGSSDVTMGLCCC